jgi:hypothetical protein
MTRSSQAKRELAALLGGGDRRSIGQAEAAAAAVLAEPARFGELFAALLTGDALIRMRAADAVEKVTRERPELLRPHKRPLLGRVAALPQQEVRWHVAQLIPRLPLTKRERASAVATLVGYLADKSRIVQAFALQALADLAGQDPALQPTVRARLEEALAAGSPAMRSRARKLLGRWPPAANPPGPGRAPGGRGGRGRKPAGAAPR